MDGEFTVRLADWGDPADREALTAVRFTVFVEEQNVPEDIEIDGLDGECVQAVAFDSNGAPIGTARLTPEGRIGRVAVIRSWRKRGVGAALMQPLIVEAVNRAQGEGVLCLHAQSWTIGFYESLGFVAEGEEFDEADIPHRHMVFRPGTP